MSISAMTESGLVLMDDDQISEFLTQNGVGILGIPDEEFPYLVPLSFGFDGDSTVYFVYLLFGTESRKETLTDQAERGRLLVYSAQSMHEWQSVSATGHISAVDGEDEWDTLQQTMENAWHSDLFSSATPMRGVQGYRFDIDDWSGIQYGIVDE
jgi:nitroimidazol reductase NimA-like FMN-containing flavoprotein (pyridoxamine 5'-phosphate oxidase superfamily)